MLFPKSEAKSTHGHRHARNLISGEEEMSVPKALKVLASKLAAVAAVCAFSSMLMSVSAEAQARRSNCDEYARDAVRQSEINDRRNCGFKGPRWSDNRTAHFGWCMIFPRQAREEQEAREAQLEECRDKRRGERAGRRASCDTYAKVAVVQAEANKKYDCGFRGGEWVDNERPHMRWCMRARRAYLLDEIRYRAGELQKCFDKLGDDDEDAEDRGYQRRRFR
jgi:hypothetical protein